MPDNIQANTQNTQRPQAQPGQYQGQSQGQGQSPYGNRQRRPARPRPPREELPFDKKIISIRRVTRVYKGGKRMRLSVVVAIGDRNGKVGIGLGKGADVKAAEEKAIRQAQSTMIKIVKKGNTIPHSIEYKKGAAKIILRPAAPGTGVIAGGPVRAVVELAGIKDILSKMIGANNSITNAYATLEALSKLISRE